MMLKKSQTAWQSYATDNCNFEGDFYARGGAGNWGPRYVENCYGVEIDKRMKYLQDLVGGKGVFGP